MTASVENHFFKLLAIRMGTDCIGSVPSKHAVLKKNLGIEIDMGKVLTWCG